jgi:general secretion pathway protein A
MGQANKESDYLSCYGLSCLPFGLSPDLKFFFPSRVHLSAREVLKYAVQNGDGFMVLTGQAGTGKTLLIRALLAELGSEKKTVVLTNPVLAPAGLLHQILLDLGLKVDANTGEANLLAIFQKILLRFGENNKEILIIVDEAQNMPLKTLEYLRMLSNIETGEKKLLQILLTGQPELEKLVNDPRLAQLRQRISVHECLRPFSLAETMQYVNYRLTKSGRGDVVFNRSARRVLHKLTGGVPRLINRLMDRTLLTACGNYEGQITGKHLKNAASTLPGHPTSGFLKSGSPLPGFVSRSFVSVTFLVLILFILGLTAYLYKGHDIWQRLTGL